MDPNPEDAPWKPARTLTQTIDAAGRTTRLAVPGLASVDLVYEVGTGRLSEIVQDDGVTLRRTQLLYDDPLDAGFLSRLLDASGRELASLRVRPPEGRLPQKEETARAALAPSPEGRL